MTRPARLVCVTVLCAALASVAGGGCRRGATGGADAPAPQASPEPVAQAGHDAILARGLMDHVHLLAGQIGERNTAHPEALEAAAEAIAASFEAYGYRGDALREQVYEVDGVRCRNIAATLAPRDPDADAADEIVVVGAHYDSAPGTAGADDNASGVAVLLELARALADEPGARTVVFVAFVNEEPPWFATADMGSQRWADAAVERARAEGKRIVAMLSLESLGYYSDDPGSQQYPPLVGAFYPDRGDFLAIVGDLDSAPLVARVRELAEATGALPVESIAAPATVPGIDWSDHRAFWRHGIPAVMATDTATFRNPHYHEPSDTPATLDAARLERAAVALEAVVRGLAAGTSP